MNGHNYEWLLNELAHYGYFELALHDCGRHQSWRVSFRKKRGDYHGWQDIKFYHADPWYALSQLWDFLKKEEACHSITSE